MAAGELVTTLDHPVVGRYRTMTKPSKFSDPPGPAPIASPMFGQHSDEVPVGVWYSAAEIAALRERGVVRLARGWLSGAAANHSSPMAYGRSSVSRFKIGGTY